MGHAGHLVVGLLPRELWNHPLVSEFGLELDVLEVVVEVPLGVTNLEVVASSGHWRDSAPLVLVFPAWELEPSFGGLSAEEKDELLLAVLFPENEESTSLRVALEVASRSISMLSFWVHGQSLTVVPVLHLPVGMLESEEARGLILLGDVELGHTAFWAEEPPVRLIGEVLDETRAESLGFFSGIHKLWSIFDLIKASIDISISDFSSKSLFAEFLVASVSEGLIFVGLIRLSEFLLHFVVSVMS